MPLQASKAQQADVPYPSIQFAVIGCEDMRIFIGARRSKKQFTSC